MQIYIFLLRNELQILLGCYVQQFANELDKFYDFVEKSISDTCLWEDANPIANYTKDTLRQFVW